MSVLNAMDYSWARPDPAQLKAAGVTVVARYLFDGGKGVTRAEIDALHAVGIGVVLNYEQQQGNHLLGARQGAVDGAEARRLAGVLGAPNLPIYYSCDREVVTTAQKATAVAYLRAADNPAHPSRCYAQYSVCEAFGRPAWQTIAWSYGNISRHAVLHQWAIDQVFHGSAVDFDQVFNAAALGAWWPSGVTPDSSNSHPLENDMTPAQSKQLAYIYAQLRSGIAAGQSSFAGTIRANLGTAQHNANQLAAIQAELTKLNGGK